MADLLDVDRSAEAGLLAVVALYLDSMLFIADAVCCDRWVM